MTPRPETFDPWQFIGWVKAHESEFYVRVVNPKTKEPELKALAELPASVWTFWANRLFMDRDAPVKTLEEWERQ